MPEGDAGGSGPSGCGGPMLLRRIAGLGVVTPGTVFAEVGEVGPGTALPRIVALAGDRRGQYARDRGEGAEGWRGE